MLALEPGNPKRVAMVILGGEHCNNKLNNWQLAALHWYSKARHLQLTPCCTPNAQDQTGGARHAQSNSQFKKHWGSGGLKSKTKRVV